MAQMALLFVGVTILVLILLLLASIYYVPKALQTNHEDEHDDEGGSTV